MKKMTAKEAIQILEDYRGSGATDFIWDAFDLAIEALKMQENDNLSSKFAENLQKSGLNCSSVIIRCKDCKFSDKFLYEEHKGQTYCTCGHYPITMLVSDNHFCGFAKRKKDNGVYNISKQI